MDRITEMIQAGIKRLSVHSFDHLHDLDLTYHRAGSKNTVFGINRALKSLDQGLRFFLGLFALGDVAGHRKYAVDLAIRPLDCPSDPFEPEHLACR